MSLKGPSKVTRSTRVTPVPRGRKPVAPGESATDKYPLKWSPMPAHHIPCADFKVKALQTVGSITKGEIYHVRLITEKGELQLAYDIERTYKMRLFALPYATSMDIGLGTDAE